MIKKMDHVALSVSNLKRSLKFYKDIIGFKIALILEEGLDTPLDEVIGLPGCTAKIAHLNLGNMMLELFEFSISRRSPLRSNGHPLKHFGWIHLSFTSTNVRADFSKLERQGVKFISKPMEFRPKVWVVYFYGPDGEVCELRETPESTAKS
jgi:glyoxylase I family protein